MRQFAVDLADRDAGCVLLNGDGKPEEHMTLDANNISQITARVWVGDQNAGKAWAELEARGITAAFNATPAADDWPPEARAALRYLRLNQEDGQDIPDARLDEFAAWIVPILTEGHVVLFHCGAGVSRSVTFASVALMLFGFSWDEALATVKARRPQANPNPVLKASVDRWWAARLRRLQDEVSS